MFDDRQNLRREFYFLYLRCRDFVFSKFRLNLIVVSLHRSLMLASLGGVSFLGHHLPYLRADLNALSLTALLLHGEEA